MIARYIHVRVEMISTCSTNSSHFTKELFKKISVHLKGERYNIIEKMMINRGIAMQTSPFSNHTFYLIKRDFARLNDKSKRLF